MGERGKQALSAQPWVPTHPTLRTLEEAARKCEGCELYKLATQAVFGEGRAGARLFLVGEQPGDSEDRNPERVPPADMDLPVGRLRPFGGGAHAGRRALAL